MVGKLAFDALMQYGVQAKTESENNIAGPALETVVEANIFLSGLGYENGGLAAAHAIALSYTRIYNLFEKHPSHDQLVAFSTLTQLMMEERSQESLDMVYGFCESVGLPITFEQPGASNLTPETYKLPHYHQSIVGRTAHAYIRREGTI
jgi:glycerol dehydrogenase